MRNPKKTLKGIFFIVIGLLLVSYVLFQSQDILRGPVIHIDEPFDGATLFYEIVDVKGKAENVAYIFLNGRQIFINTEGQFEEKLIAPIGYSIIELVAEDRFGRRSTKRLHIIVQKETTLLPSIDLKTNATTSTTTIP